MMKHTVSIDMNGNVDKTTPGDGCGERSDQAADVSRVAPVVTRMVCCRFSPRIA